MNESTYTILVIDDEPIARVTLAALLDKLNCRVEMAEDGVQGLELAKQICPDVILLDVMLPRLDGFEVCKRIRSDPQIGEAPIIMITAFDDREAELKGLKAGADDFISKPFDSLILETRLQSLKDVNRYRHLMEERGKLRTALADLSGQHAQLHKVSKQIFEAQEGERRHVAAELHDDIGELITGLKLILERGNEDVSVISDARIITNELFQRLREISLNLRPADLDDLGLSAALDGLFKRFAKQNKITVHHNINPLNDRRFDKAVEITVFRVVQEALTNVVHHAGVSDANVTLAVTPYHMQVSIADAGRGFDINSKDGCGAVGISGMKERVSVAGGNFSIQSTPGKGTLVSVDFDLKPVE